MYNVCDLIGRYIPLLESLKMESRKMLTIVIVGRLLFVPAFYFTAKYGTQGWMIMLTSLLGLTNGYLTVCVLTSAPKGYMVGLLNSHNFSGFSKFVFRSINVVHFYFFFMFAGTRTKCFGKRVGVVSSCRYFCRCNT